MQRAPPSGRPMPTGRGSAEPGRSGSPVLERSHGGSFRPFSTPTRSSASSARARGASPGRSSSCRWLSWCCSWRPRRLAPGAAVRARQQHGGEAPFRRRRGDLRALAGRPGRAADPRSVRGAPAAHRGGPPGGRRRLHRRHGHRRASATPTPSRTGSARSSSGTIEPALAGQRRTPRASTARSAARCRPRSRSRPTTARSWAWCRPASQVKNVSGMVDRQLPLLLGRRSRRARPGHRRHGAGEQAAAAPDPRPGPGRDDPDVRAPRRGAARRPRGRAHRRRRRAAAAGQRRGPPAAGPAAGRRGAARHGTRRPRPDTAELLASGRVATDEVHLAGDRLLAVNQRPTDRHGGPPGSVATLRDSTELRALSGRAEVARERLRLLYDAGVGIGTTLDVVRTAEELARGRRAPVRRLRHRRPGRRRCCAARSRPAAATDMRRTAAQRHPGRPSALPGRRADRLPVASTPQARGLGSGRAVLVPDLPTRRRLAGPGPGARRRRSSSTASTR